VNTTGEEKRVPIEGVKKGLISKREFQQTLILGPMEADLVE
jgi:hypothetical protein